MLTNTAMLVVSYFHQRQQHKILSVMQLIARLVYSYPLAFRDLLIVPGPVHIRGLW